MKQGAQSTVPGSRPATIFTACAYLVPAGTIAPFNRWKLKLREARVLAPGHTAVGTETQFLL